MMIVLFLKSGANKFIIGSTFNSNQ